MMNEFERQRSWRRSHITRQDFAKVEARMIHMHGKFVLEQSGRLARANNFFTAK
jgi:hypothetical protein